nr:ATP-binding protein [Arthrobacter antioxidans]
MRLRALLELRAVWLRGQWSHDPRREFSDRVITEDHADWLLRGEDVRGRDRFYATAPEALRLRSEAEAASREAVHAGAVAADAGIRPPALEVLRRLFRLGEAGRDVLLLALAPEIDPSFGPLYAYLQDDMSRQFPTAHLAVALLALPPAVTGLLAETAPLRRYQLVQVHAVPPQPAAAAALFLDERIRDYLLGVNRPDRQLEPYLRPVPAGPLTAAQREQARRGAAHLAAHHARTGEWKPVSLPGPPDSGQAEMAHAVCTELGISLYSLDAPHWPADPRQFGLLEREALLLQTAYYCEPDHTGASPGPRPAAPVFTASGEAPPDDPSALILRPAAAAAVDRLEWWEEELGSDAAAVNGLLPALVEQYEFGPGTIRRTAQAARLRAELEHQPLHAAHLWASSRDAVGGNLGELAQRVEPSFHRNDLVLPPQAQQQLDEMVDQVRNRHTVYVRWGLGTPRGRGISALFAGPSGTGKTMAAEVVADQLELALYRIDLAGLISKYVGETEKNMRRVFDAARRRGAVLFFDEADALFGKRTDVKDSHDRFANIEINYLLQQMESYAGLSILATNRSNALDRAFLRRLRFVVEFVFPDAVSRRRIWQRAFPQDVPLSPLDLDRLARLEIPGGNIRNIALNAAFLAAARKEPVGMDLLMQAARSEYTKIEKLQSDAEFGEYTQ